MKSFIVLVMFLIFAVANSETEEAIRTDLIRKTVSAISASLHRRIAECDSQCAAATVQFVQRMEFDKSAMSNEAKDLVQSLKGSLDVDWSPVDSWLNRLKDIQKTYFESVLKYRDRKNDPVQDALFYLDIGEIHNAASELLANQKTLMGIVADLSTVLEIVQRGRTGWTLKLAVQLADLTPYHETFGCAHNVSGGDDSDCAELMRASFRKSYQSLQKVLNRFFIEEMPEIELDDEPND